MILTFILNLLYVFLNFVFNLLPSGSVLPEALQSFFRYIFGFLWNFDRLVSVELVIQLLALALAVEVGILLFDMIVWVIHLIRGK